MIKLITLISSVLRETHLKIMEWQGSLKEINLKITSLHQVTQTHNQIKYSHKV